MPSRDDQLILRMIGEDADLLAAFERVQAAARGIGDVEAEIDIRTDKSEGRLEGLEADVRKLDEFIETADPEFRVEPSFKTPAAEVRAFIEDIKSTVKAGLDDNLGDLDLVDFEAETAELNRYQAELDELFADFDRLTRQAAKFNAVGKRLGEPVEQANRLEAEIKEVGTEILRTTERADRLRIRLGLSMRESAKAADDLRARTRRAGGALDDFGRRGAGGLKGLLTAFRSLRAAAAAFFATIAANRLLAFIKDAEQARQKLAALRQQFELSSGSIEAGAETMEFLRRVANDLGLDFEAITERYAGFEIAAKRSNLTQDQTRAIFLEVARAAAVLKLSQEDTNGVLQALEQIAAKGVVSMEELRQQLGDRIPVALSAMADGLGISTEKLIELVSQGDVLAQDALPALARGLRETFSESSGDIDENVRAMARLKLAAFEARAEFAERFRPELLALLEALTRLVTDGAPAVEAVGRAVGIATKALTVAATAAGLMGTRIRGSISALALFRAEAVTALGSATTAVLRFNAALADLSGSDVAAQKLRDFADTVEETYKDQAKSAQEFIQEQKRLHDQEVANRREANDRLKGGFSDYSRFIKAGALDNAERQEELARRTARTELEALKKREDGFASFFRSIAKLSDEDRGGGTRRETGAGADGAQQANAAASAVERLNREIQEIRSKPIISAEEGERLFELRRQLFDAEVQARKFGDAQASAAQQTEAAADAQGIASDAILEALDKLVRGNEAFAETYRQLPPASRSALESLIGDLARLSQSGEVTGDDLQAFGARFASILQEGGQASSGFAERVRRDLLGLPPSAASVTDALADVRQELRETEGAAQATGGGFVQAGDKVVAFGDTSDVVVPKAAELTTELDRQKEAARAHGAGFIEMGDRLETVGGKIPTIADSFERLRETQEAAGEGGERAGEGGERAAAGADKAATAAAAATPQVQSLGEAGMAGGEGLASAATEAERLASASERLAQADTGADGIAAQAESLATLQEPLATAADETERLAAARDSVVQSGEALPAIFAEEAEALPALSEGLAVAVSEGLDPFAASTDEAVEGAEGLSTATTAAGDAASEAAPKIAEGSDAVEELGSRSTDAQGHLASLAEVVAGDLNPALDEVPGLAGAAKTALVDLGGPEAQAGLDALIQKLQEALALLRESRAEAEALKDSIEDAADSAADLGDIEL